MQNKSIDNGKSFDWGRTSADYAVYRDIYPPVFYEKIVERGLCTKGHKCLDIGTGTGVVPRNMHKGNPDWNGAGEIRKPIFVPDEYLEFFDITYREEFDVKVPFTRESWHGRMKACRGVGASMSEETIERWSEEHIEMLNEYDEEFEVLHYVAIAELAVNNESL